MEQIFNNVPFMARRHRLAGQRHFWFKGTKDSDVACLALPAGTQDGGVLAMRRLGPQEFEEAMLEKGGKTFEDIEKNFFGSTTVMLLREKSSGVFELKASFTCGPIEEMLLEEESSDEVSGQGVDPEEEKF